MMIMDTDGEIFTPEQKLISELREALKAAQEENARLREMGAMWNDCRAAYENAIAAYESKLLDREERLRLTCEWSKRVYGTVPYFCNLDLPVEE